MYYIYLAVALTVTAHIPSRASACASMPYALRLGRAAGYASPRLTSTRSVGMPYVQMRKVATRSPGFDVVDSHQALGWWQRACNTLATTRSRCSAALQPQGLRVRLGPSVDQITPQASNYPMYEPTPAETRMTSRYESLEAARDAFKQEKDDPELGVLARHWLALEEDPYASWELKEAAHELYRAAYNYRTLHNVYQKAVVQAEHNASHVDRLTKRLYDQAKEDYIQAGNTFNTLLQDYTDRLKADILHGQQGRLQE